MAKLALKKDAETKMSFDYVQEWKEVLFSLLVLFLSLFLTVLLLLLFLTQYQDILVTKGTFIELKLGAKTR